MISDEKSMSKGLKFDVFGKTPFQHELTAEPMGSITLVNRVASAPSTWQQTSGTVITISAVPGWMTPPRPY